MRREFGNIIAELVKKDKRVHLISLDIGYGIFDKLKKENPNHYWNLGVTEQASIGIASGMALQGLRPYVYSITPFVLDKVVEQLKLDVVEQNSPVRIIGFWGYPKDGPTHKSNDVKGLCKIIGIKLFEPQNSKETREMILDNYKGDKPAFFSLTEDSWKQV
jgi:transketolase